jgi:uncharacterized delta-60 repeat protein
MFRGFAASLLLCASGAQAAIVADPGFGNGGSVVVNMQPTLFHTTPKLGLVADGRILAAGIGDRDPGELSVLNVTRLTADGVVDAGFGSAGVSTVALSNVPWSYTWIEQMQPQADGGALLLVSLMDLDGVPPQYGATTLLLRLGADGRLAPGFNGGAILPLDNLQANAFKLVTQSGATLVFASAVTESGGSHMQVMRIRADGVPDPGFGTGGTLSADSAAALAMDLMALPDGGFQVLYLQRRQGGQKEYNFWRRYRADGSLNTAYGSGGDLVFISDPRRVVEKLFPLPDGYQLGANAGAAMALLDRQGQVVRQFFYRADSTQFNAQALGDKILLSGEQRFGGVPPPSDGTYLHLIDYSGNADPGFGNPPLQGWRPPDEPNDSFAVAADRQGRILLARRDSPAGLRVFRYRDLRGDPGSVPVPVLGPAGLSLAALGLLWLARRRLLPG